MKQRLTLEVNGREHDLLVEPSTTLVRVLREDLGLTGAKEGCEMGSCGACTVLLDGVPALSCLLLAVSCRGRQITTIEALARGGELHPIQQAFVDAGAIQCGMCAPGMILSTKALLDSNRAPTDLDIRAALSGNVCRCTGYAKIIAAVRNATTRVINTGDGTGKGDPHARAG